MGRSNVRLQLPLGEFVRACLRLGLPLHRSYRAFKAGGGYCLPHTFAEVWYAEQKRMPR